MRRIRHLTNRHRAPSTDLMLGLLLAFNAGAVNAGGFLILRMYTSHMTGFASQLADGLVLGGAEVMLNALGAIIAFTTGAALCAFLVNWARQKRLNSVYALPLMLEALMMFPFGLMGAITLTWSTPFAVPVTVLLLSFMMGLQNAVGSKTSGGSTRTTHMTGNFTDLGMELGKLVFWRNQRGAGDGPPTHVHHDWARMKVSAGLIAMFVLGGISGALGFKYIGFFCVVPLAALLLVISVPPFLRDAAQANSAISNPFRRGR
ncbi:DUF1275 domain-containing protein [Comamonas testosteroni]|uniref:DUF1275 domain-containing protein n=1 Tax=Comamonas testosteroni TaxID=285 RepID=A0A373FMK2_COMTE|nr:YoaK family protein [Comamonas testosteroni]RGE45401.1 DUF1275 domain-containing protein [Comamonas testosteroni]